MNSLTRYGKWGLWRSLLQVATGIAVLAGQASAQPTTDPGLFSVPTSPLLTQESGPVPGSTTPAAPTRKVNKFLVEAGSFFSPEEVQTIVSGREGKDLTLAEIKAVADDLTKLLQSKGHLLARAFVPAQSFASGEVRIQVFEGKVGEVTVEGNKHYSSDFILGYFKTAQETGNLTTDSFQRSLLLLQEFSDLQVRAVLRPGKAAGTADIVLKVTDFAPVHPGLSYNNFGIKDSGEHRVGVSLDAGNLGTDGSNLNLQALVGFPGSNTFFQAGYRMPIDSDGSFLAVGYANGAFTTSPQLGVLDIRGAANIYTVAYEKALERELDFRSDLSISASSKSVENNFELVSQGVTLPFTRENYYTARLGYRADWRDANGRTLFQGAVSQGFAGSPFQSVRTGADGNFTKFNIDGARLHSLGPNLFGVVRGQGQWATHALPVAEQFSVGGPDSVRGYGQAELLADNAYILSAELRWSPIEDLADKFQLAFFVDHGGVSNVSPQPGDFIINNRKVTSLTGAGMGFRYGFSEFSSLRVDVGFPISPNVNQNGINPAVYTGLQTRF